jgi:hypothetical protein
MTLWILDTDHISLWQRQHTPLHSWGTQATTGQNWCSGSSDCCDRVGDWWNGCYAQSAGFWSGAGVGD